MATKYNCEKNGIKYFRKTKTIGHDFYGKPIKKEFYGDGEKDVDRQIKEFMKKIESGINIQTETLTVEQGMYQWLWDVLLLSKNKKSASFEKHEANFRNYIKDQKIGCLPILTATSLHFQKYYNDLYLKGHYIYNARKDVKEPKKVSSEKIFDLNKTLRAFFTYCVKQHYRNDNPCALSNIEIPGNADGEEDSEDIEGNDIQVFNDEEMEIIIDNLKYEEHKDNTFNVMVLLDLMSGLRSGELRGLKNKFLKDNTVKVINNLKIIKVFDSPTSWHREMKLIKPKSDSSIRNVNLPSSIAPILDKYTKEQEKKWKKQGLEFSEDSLLFTTSSCKPIDSTNFRRAWQRFLKRIGVEYRKPHSMRDTYATTLIRKGATMTTVKELLGHSSIQITEKYYIFVFPSDKSETANLMNDILHQKPSREKVGK